MLGVVLTGSLFYAGCQVPVATSGAAITEVHNKAFTPKKLKCTQMRLLNIELEDSLSTVVRIKVTCARAIKAINAVDDIQSAIARSETVAGKKHFATDEDERLFIAGHMKLLLDPVRQFLALVRKHKSIVTPVIAESLGITTKDIDKSWFLKFFESKDDAQIFFDHAIKTLDDVKSSSIEFIVLFGDVYESLSEQTRKACDDMIRKMQEAQKQATEQKKV